MLYLQNLMDWLIFIQLNVDWTKSLFLIGKMWRNAFLLLLHVTNLIITLYHDRLFLVFLIVLWYYTWINFLAAKTTTLKLRERGKMNERKKRSQFWARKIKRKKMNLCVCAKAHKCFHSWLLFSLSHTLCCSWLNTVQIYIKYIWVSCNENMIRNYNKFILTPCVSYGILCCNHVNTHTHAYNDFDRIEISKVNRLTTWTLTEIFLLCIHSLFLSKICILNTLNGFLRM